MPDSEDTEPNIETLLKRIDTAMREWRNVPEGDPLEDPLWAEATEHAESAADLIDEKFPDAVERLASQLLEHLDDKIDFLITELGYCAGLLEPEHRTRLREGILGSKPRAPRTPRPRAQAAATPSAAAASQSPPPRAPRPRPDEEPAGDDDLESLATKLHRLFDDIGENRDQWIVLTIDLAITLRAARARFPADIEFSGWLHETELAERINDDDRAALISMGGNPTLLREVLEETARRSWQHIWRESQDRFRHVTKPPEDEPGRQISTAVQSPTLDEHGRLTMPVRLPDKLPPPRKLH